MDKPNYPFWEQQPEFTLEDAAALCCDIEPEKWDWQHNPKPKNVEAMERRLKQDVDHRDTSRMVTAYNVFSGKTEPTRVRGDLVFRREALKEWADKTGQRKLMPVLFPEDRGSVETGRSSMRSDTSEALLFIIGLLAHALARQGGNDLRTGAKLNQLGIAKAIKAQAEQLGAEIRGLGETQLSERLKDALAEVDNRRKGSD
jgi:hypothetical protein